MDPEKTEHPKDGESKGSEKTFYIVLSIVILGILVFFIAAKIMKPEPKTIDEMIQDVLEGKETEDAFNYNGFIFIRVANMWHFRWEKDNQVFEASLRFNPRETENVPIENYGLEMATKLTSGVDVWLNTPIPPFEASGTSGMKAAHNGVINFSVLDGWWVEGCIEGVTGWAIGPSPKEKLDEAERRHREITQLYDKLEYLIIPKFYRKRDDWIRLMENSIGKVAYYFNSHRMMRRYASEAYL